MLAQQRQAAGGHDLQKNKINNPKLDASKRMCVLCEKMFSKIERKDIKRTNKSIWGARRRKIVGEKGSGERTEFLWKG